jgi:hypothetical protein
MGGDMIPIVFFLCALVLVVIGLSLRADGIKGHGVGVILAGGLMLAASYLSRNL